MKANIQRQESDPEQARIFFALWPPLAQRQQLHDLAVRYHKLCGGRVMRAETLHLTLLFLGAVPTRRLQVLCNALDGLEASPFLLTLGQFCCWRHNRIGYVTTTGQNAALSRLAQALREAVSMAGFSFEERAFSPHVTLLRHVEHALEPQSVVHIEWPVESIALVESVVTDRGVSYRTLHRWDCQP